MLNTHRAVGIHSGLRATIACGFGKYRVYFEREKGGVRLYTLHKLFGEHASARPQFDDCRCRGEVDQAGYFSGDGARRRGDGASGLRPLHNLLYKTGWG